jgi:amino acid adenylation domain-containing protein
MSTTLEIQEIAEAGYRLSPQQARLWRSQLLGGAKSAQCVILIEGSLHADVLRDALRLVVQRHEILRTTFQDVPGMKVPVQVVHEQGEPAWREVELGDVDELMQAAAIENICRDEIARAATLPHGAQLRAVLARINSHERQHLLVLSLPALCSDSLSLGNLMTHLARGYAEMQNAGAAGVEAAVVDRESASDQEPPLQYAQFSEWQNELFEDEASAGRAWWQEQREAARVHDGADAMLVLPLDDELAGNEAAAAAATQRTWRQRVERRLTATSVAAIAKLTQAQGKNSATLFLACWQVLLARLSERSRFPLRVLCGGRIYQEMQDALGLYAKWPRVQFHVDANSSFAEVLEQTDKMLAHATEWQEYYFAQDFAPDFTQDNEGVTLSDAAQQDIGFEFFEWPAAREVGGTRFTLLKQHSVTERLKLKLGCVSAPRFAALQFDYDPSVYTAEETERLADRFLTLLDSLLQDPELAVKDVQLLSEGERRQLLYEWNDTRNAEKTDQCLHELFEAQAARTPDRPAVVCGAATLTYRELDVRANQLAHRLQQAGVGAESLVAILLDRSVELLVAVLGILKAGGAYLPLDLSQPSQRLELILQDAGIAAVLTHERLKERLPETATEIICLDSERETIERQSTQKPATNICYENTVYVIYTSGSTGQPKGVSICHRSAVNLAQALAQAVYAGTDAPLRVSVNAPLAFDSSVKQLLQLLYGHTLYIVPEEIRPDGAALLEFIRSNKLDVLDCTPSQLRLLLDAGFGDGNETAPAIALVGGEAIDGPLWNTLCAHGQTAYFNVYGPTECTVDATACRVTSALRPRIGRPVANVQVYVLDQELKPLPVGLMGEIYIGGEGVARGYVNQPELTADRFLPHPFSDIDGARLYRTGDRGRFLPGGELECAGRVDHQVKLRGYRVELGEIEAALAEHEAVRGAVAMVREDRPGDRRLVAYIVLAREGLSQLSEWRDYLRQKLPEYMLPSALIPLKAFPLTRNGKIDRFKLPAPDEVETGKTFVAPRTPVEEVLAGIWAQLFGLKQVSVEDNFFELGGHSLLATQVISRARKVFQVEIAVRSLFESPTVATLAEQVSLEMQAGREQQFAPIECVSRDAAIPASFAQQRLWFLHELMPGSSAYQLHVSLRIKGPLDVAVLEQTFNEVVRRHEILRTTFATVDGQLVQVIAAAQPFKLRLIDLRDRLPDRSLEEREAEARQLAALEARQPFDLARDPVLRVALWQIAPEDHIVSLTMHHIASDEWSMNVLVRESLQIYEAFSAGRPSPLLPLPVQYADYAVWQRRRLEGERLEAELAYWKQQLGDGPYVLNLPTDHARPVIQTSHGVHQPLTFSKTLVDALKALSRQEEATLFMTLLAACKILLHHYAEQTSIIIGTPIADRDQVETEELIGFFVNMLVMRTDLSGDPSFRELLRRVREVALGAYAHQSLPFDKLVEELKPPRDLSRNPLFQAAFTFDSSPPQDLKLAQLEIQPLEIEGRATRFDLVFALRETGDGLAGAIQYNGDLFNAPRITRMRDHLAMLLEILVVQPETKLSELRAKLFESDRQHHDQQRQGFKRARSRMLETARQKPAGESGSERR